MDLPVPNTLIPKNFEILDQEEAQSEKPTLVHEKEGCEVWYMKDDKFKLPKAYIACRIYTNDCNFGSTTDGRVFVNVWE